MRKLLALLTSGVLFLGLALTGGNSAMVEAQSRVYTIDNYNVEMRVNADSTMDVTEELNYTFNGEFNGMFREITLEDSANQALCLQNNALQCGGFDFIKLKSVFVDGQAVPEGRYQTEIVTKSGEDRFRVQFRFDPDDTVVLHNEKHSFKITYSVLGSIGFFADYSLFYWNLIFSDRDVTVDNAQVKIIYPAEVNLSRENTTVITGLSPRNYTQNPASGATREVVYTTQQVTPYVDFTVLQKIPLGIIKQPGNLTLEGNISGIEFSAADFDFKTNNPVETIKSLPAGIYNVEFSADGYFSQSKRVEITGGKTTVVNLNLEPTPLTRLIGILIALANICCCSLVFLGPAGVFLLWYRKGRDFPNHKAVIPEFNPPSELKPYFVGSLVDESVDIQDITASIVSLAVQGYLKIEELPAKNIFSSRDFELHKTEKSVPENPVEAEILDDLFGIKKSVKLSELKYKFYAKLPALQEKIYKELVDAGYFPKKPNHVRQGWYGWGAAILFGGLGLGFFLANLSIFSGMCAAATTGLAMIFAARFMPAKTAEGSEMLRQVNGFKMYLTTAEKHTLQNLKPHQFEAYLPYAMVFGVERQWAEKFKDLYTSPPDWYTGGNWNTFNTYLLVDSLRSFNTTASTSMTAAPSSSSSSGGGWSGGGGFSGGFSGGGGGGGGGGAW